MRLLPAGLALLAVACGGAEVSSTVEPGGDGCAHVVQGRLTAEPDGAYTVEATVRSADTGEEKYADAWEVRAPDGTVLGTRELLHPHVEEQPFTRSLGGVVIPEGVERVEVAARDSVLGFCGDTITVPVP